MLKKEDKATKNEVFFAELEKAKPFVYFVERDICLLIQDLVFEGEKSTHLNPALGVELLPIGDIRIGKSAFYSARSLEDTSDALELLSKKYGYQKLTVMGDACRKAAQTLIGGLKSNTDLGAVERLQNFKTQYVELAVYLPLVVFAGKFLENKVKELIREKTGNENERYFRGIVYPRKLNEGTEEVIELLKIAEYIKDKKKSIDEKPVVAEIERHWEKFSWLGTRWDFEPIWTLDEMKTRVERFVKKNPSEELELLFQPREEAEDVTKEFIEKYHLTVAEQELINLVKEFVYLRTFRSEGLIRASVLSRPLLSGVATKLAISERELFLLTIDEIIEALRGKLDYKSYLEERKKGYAMALLSNQTYIFTGEDKERMESLDMFQRELGSTQKIQGQIAWRGKARGTVRIVKIQADCERVMEGDILVSVMTFPNYIAAMERAAAFVTDEGGILCHAAIVSREMKKPCIIGTKTATRALKDGDLVEVDADNGTVRILK
jgi:phosphohistidine swiveling domain-containing protein